MPFRIRILNPAEIPQITALIQASVLALQADYTPAQREAALTTVFTVDTRLIADGGYFGAETEDGRLVACGGWSARRTLYGGDHQLEASTPDLLDPAVDAARIRAIFVHPDFARRGLGSLILEAAEQAARTSGFRRFEMGSTLTGVSLYTRSGYREIERHHVPIAPALTIEIVRMLKEGT